VERRVAIAISDGVDVLDRIVTISQWPIQYLLLNLVWSYKTRTKNRVNTLVVDVDVVVVVVQGR